MLVNKRCLVRICNFTKVSVLELIAEKLLFNYKQLWLKNVLTFLLLFISVSVLGQSFKLYEVPNPKDWAKGYISDPADILSDAEEQVINKTIADLEDSTSVQMAVVMLPSIGDEDPKLFTSDLMNKWGVGQKGKDNGLLILTVMDQRRTEFETGYGLEYIITDAQCYEVGMQKLVPYFKDEEYGKGILAAVTAFSDIIKSYDPNDASVDPLVSFEREYGIPGWALTAFIIYILCCIFCGIIFNRLIAKSLKDKEDFYDKYMDLRKLKQYLWLVLFPIPYFFVLQRVKRKMKELRYAPRYSKHNHKPMTLASEEEEDQYLSQGQITEEAIGAADYDVWVTDNADDILILRYDIYFDMYDYCPSCTYEAYYKSRSYTAVHATQYSSGTDVKEYSCKNCHFFYKETYVIPRIPKISTSRRSSSGSSGRGWSGGSSSWGGGSSGGGGAGVSW